MTVQTEDTQKMNPVLRLLNELNANFFWVIVAFLMISAIAFVPLAFVNPVQGILGFTATITVVVLFITQANWYRAHFPEEDNTLDDLLETSEDAAEENTEEVTEPAVIRTYAQEFIHTGIIMVLYLPFYFTSWGMLFLAMSFARNAHQITDSEFLARILMYIPMIFAFILFPWAIGFCISVGTPSQRKQQNIIDLLKNIVISLSFLIPFIILVVAIAVTLFIISIISELLHLSSDVTQGNRFKLG